MFVRVKRSEPGEYLQIVENFREGKKVRQRVIANLGRLDILKSTCALDLITTSLARLSENVAVISCVSARGRSASGGQAVGLKAPPVIWKISPHKDRMWCHTPPLCP